MYKTTQQQKATAEREREEGFRKPEQKTKEEVLQRQKGSSEEKKGGLYKRFFSFFAKATEHEIPQTSTGFTKTADRGRWRRRRGARERGTSDSAPSVSRFKTRPSPLPHTRESTEKTKDKNSYSSSVYTAYSQHTQREKSP